MIWWDCSINVRVVGQSVLKGGALRGKGENKLSRCCLFIR